MAWLRIVIAEMLGSGGHFRGLSICRSSGHATKGLDTESLWAQLFLASIVMWLAQERNILQDNNHVLYISKDFGGVLVRGR